MESMSTKERFVELRAEGISYDKIAADLGVSKKTLLNWSKENRRLIRNLRAIRLESLQQQYFVAKELRIQLLGERVLALKAELEKRDLSKVSTDKLLDLLLRYGQQLRAEETEISFEEVGLMHEAVDLDPIVKWPA